MKSIAKIYRIGYGPSSSHTMAPRRAAEVFAQAYPQASEYRVVLYGSLAKTGKGHMTDEAIKNAFAPKKTDVVFDFDKTMPHPNTMDFYAIDKGCDIGHYRVLSTGGGSIVFEGSNVSKDPDIYPHEKLSDIIDYCAANGLRLWQYVESVEGSGFFSYLSEVWKVMCEAITRGLASDGILPGGLNTMRRAKMLCAGYEKDEEPETRENRLVCAYAFAVSEENAAMGRIVTAPTCGSCGVVPAVMRYMQEKNGYSDEQIIKALATAGLIGGLIKTNASISGAECGCQAEIGAACSMAAAALAELKGMKLEQIEYAAEVAMEHHLGLTCDPIGGLVQIPCIERNAVAAMRSINSVSIAQFLTNSRKISFDTVIEAMYSTGLDMHHSYRETSEGGLAVKYIREEERK